MKKRIQLLIDDDDLALLDLLAEEQKKHALWGEVGYRPAVIHALLDLVRKSQLPLDVVIKRECVLLPVNT